MYFYINFLNIINPQKFLRYYISVIIKLYIYINYT